MLNKKVNSKNTGIKLQRIKFVQSLQYRSLTTNDVRAVYNCKFEQVHKVSRFFVIDFEH